MSKTLIIAEKPSVAADIAKVVGAEKSGSHSYVGDDHVVSWAVGHLLEFCPPEDYDDRYKRWRLKDLPILPDSFQLSPVRRTTKQLNAVKKLIKSGDIARVVNACDAGREGELIFREIYRYSGTDKPVERLWLQSMTGTAIRDSLEATRDSGEVQGLADAADCRAESDWLIGMNATRALTVRLRNSRDREVWSAGRVQTATLAMLVGREREILAHEPQPYWIIQATFEVPGDASHSYSGTWFNPKADAPRDRIFDAAKRDQLVKLLEAGKGSPEASETRKDRSETAPPLLDLTTLQREANRRFGFSARRTLSAAQKLYEQYKLITYPRTDSRALPNDYRSHVQGALEFLSSKSGFDTHARNLLDIGLANEGRNFNDAAVTDHFAIIPTGEGSSSELSGDESRIFDLITRRFLAAFHPPAISTEIERITVLEDENFRTRRKILKVPGWRAVWNRDGDAPQDKLPPLPQAEKCAVAVQGHECEEKETRPPQRLTEATLLGLMETAGRQVDDDHLAQVLKETGGLGTPATRAEMIETLLKRQYGSRCVSTDGRKALRATARGIRLIDALERIDLPRLTSAELTADLEDSLRAMERGERERNTYMDEIRSWTEVIVDRIRGFSFDTLYDGTEDIGECSISGQAVRETLRSYCCAKGAREDVESFLLWKEIRGRYIDRASAIQILNTGETPVKAGFFTPDNREYEASMHRTEEGRIEVRPRGQSGEMEGLEDLEPLDVGPCPYHPENTVKRGPRGYRCDFEGDEKCKLNIPLRVCQRTFQVEEVQALTGEERKTALLEGFISKRNRPFSATLHLTDEGGFRWEFPPRNSGRGGDRAMTEFEVNPAPLVTCPTCKSGNIIESPTTFICDNDSCAKIQVPREICKRELTRSEAEALFGANETPLLEGFTSKAGKPFSATLYLKKNGRHGFRFPDRN